MDAATTVLQTLAKREGECESEPDVETEQDLETEEAAKEVKIGGMEAVKEAAKQFAGMDSKKVVAPIAQCDVESARPPAGANASGASSSGDSVAQAAAAAANAESLEHFHPRKLKAAAAAACGAALSGEASQKFAEEDCFASSGHESWQVAEVLNHAHDTLALETLLDQRCLLSWLPCTATHRTISSCCRSLHAIAKDDVVWQGWLANDFPHVQQQGRAPGALLSTYKFLYKGARELLNFIYQHSADRDSMHGKLRMVHDCDSISSNMQDLCVVALDLAALGPGAWKTSSSVRVLPKVKVLEGIHGWVSALVIGKEAVLLEDLIIVQNFNRSWKSQHRQWRKHQQLIQASRTANKENRQPCGAQKVSRPRIQKAFEENRTCVMTKK